MVETPREGGTCGMPGATAVYIGRGDAIFEFTVPTGLDPGAVQNLKLNLTTDAGVFNPPSRSSPHIVLA